MRRSIGVLTVSAVIALCLASAGSAVAASKTVCSSGCAFTSIQAAIEAATPGATITIGAGNYTENVVVDKSVTLQGSGVHTVIYPGASNPVCSPGSLCEGAASSIILVQADNVTITKVKLEGDNPALSSGVVRGGKDIDARNGIITNHTLGTFNNLTVSKVVIADIYLRGVYASSGGSFNFNHDTVENVQGEEASIAMFNFEGTGVMSHNKVVSANDAISANWSKGTQFLDNKVSKSGSGIHTDNNGGSGGTTDSISGNKISECTKDGYGIFVFAPYVSANVDSTRSRVATSGSPRSAARRRAKGRRSRATRSTAQAPRPVTSNGTYGAYLTTDLLGFGFGDVNATLSGNSFEHSGTGVFVTQNTPTEGQSEGGQATVTASNNTIHANGVGTAAPARSSTRRTTGGVANRARTRAPRATPPRARSTTHRG